MYYEEAKVKEYKSKNKKTGAERTNFQINLTKESKFRKPKEIALIDIAEIQEIEKSLDSSLLNETEAKYNELLEEHEELKQQFQQLKATNESLTSELESLKEEKVQLQEDLLNAEDKSEEIIQLQKEHKEEIAELNEEVKSEKDKLSEEKEENKGLLATITKLTSKNTLLEKENIFLKNRSFYSRLINKQYSEEETVPEVIESNVKD